ncbi:MAG: hypothetical protein V3R49_03405 [Gammaproteobacteria bacterium]
MAIVAAVGGAVAVVVNNAAAPLITAIFAYVGILLVFACIAMILIGIPCYILYGDAEPTRYFQLWLVGVTILLAILTLWVTAWFIYPNPGASVSSGFSFFGSIASPFIILGIGGSVIEAVMTHKEQRQKR